MVFWTCNIDKINPKFDSETKSVLKQPGEHIFDKVNNIKLYLYVDSLQTSFHAITILNYAIDRPIKASSREQGIVVIKETVPFNVCIFEEMSPLSNLVCIFAPDNIASLFRYALRMIVSSKVREHDETGTIQMVTPILPVKFRLKERENEIRKYLPNIKELSVKQIKDMYVHGASLRGVLLESSEEYHKYVRDRVVGGQVNYFGVTFRDRVFMLSSEGKIWTRQGKMLAGRLPEVDVVRELLLKLFEADAILIYEY